MLRKLIALCSVTASLMVFGEGFQNTEVGVLVTTAQMGKVNEGKVVKYYPHAALSHHTLFKNRWMLILDPNDPSVKPLPLAIQNNQMSASALQTLTPLVAGWAKLPPPTTPGITNPTPNANAGTAPANQPAPPQLSLLPSGDNGQATVQVDSNNPMQLFLGKAADASGSSVQANDPSVLLRIGKPEVMANELEQYKSDPRKLYAMHFLKYPLRMTIVEERPGRRDVQVAEVEGLYLVRHRVGGTSYFILPGTSGESLAPAIQVPLDSMVRDSSSLSFQVDAQAFNAQIVGPSLLREGFGQASPDFATTLSCLIPSDAQEKTLTACQEKRDGSGNVQKLVVQGSFTSSEQNPKPIRYWISQLGNETNFLRVELSLLSPSDTDAFQAN